VKNIPNVEKCIKSIYNKKCT